MPIIQTLNYIFGTLFYVNDHRVLSSADLFTAPSVKQFEDIRLDPYLCSWLCIIQWLHIKDVSPSAPIRSPLWWPYSCWLRSATTTSSTPPSTNVPFLWTSSLPSPGVNAIWLRLKADLCKEKWPLTSSLCVLRCRTVNFEIVKYLYDFLWASCGERRANERWICTFIHKDEQNEELRGLLMQLCRCPLVVGE